MKKGIKNISGFAFRMTLLAGLLVGVLAVSTAPYRGAEVCVSDSEQESPEKEVLKAFDAITSLPQVSLNHEFLLLDVLPGLTKEEDEEGNEEATLPGSKIFRILFRRIISPNAP